MKLYCYFFAFRAVRRGSEVSLGLQDVPVPIELGYARISVNFYRDDILILKEGLSLSSDVEHPLDVKHPKID